MIDAILIILALAMLLTNYTIYKLSQRIDLLSEALHEMHQALNRDRRYH